VAEARVSQRLATALLVVLLLAAGGLAWSLQLGARLAVDPANLERLPRRIGDWEGRDVPLGSVVEQMLRADFNLQRDYRGPDGEWIAVYVGYYGTARGGRPEHTPPVCYDSQGWEIVDSREVELDPARGLRATRMTVAQAGERHLVLFWYRSQQRTGIVGLTGLSLERLRSRITSGRADGALVRVSTPLGRDGVGAAESRLGGFARVLDALLDRHWPEESGSVALHIAVAGVSC
jgi:EpsI family protein